MGKRLIEGVKALLDQESYLFVEQQDAHWLPEKCVFCGHETRIKNGAISYGHEVNCLVYELKRALREES